MLVGFNDISANVFVPTSVVLYALGGVALAITSYFLKKPGARNNTIYGAYWLMIMGAGTLTFETGMSASPFFGLWLITAVFAGIFGKWTIIILLALNLGYGAHLYLIDDLTTYNFFAVVFGGAPPLIVSYILWHGRSKNEKIKEKAYYDIANELSEVANKSEAVIDAISDGVIAVNNQGQIDLINPAAQRFVGWKQQDALGLQYKSVLQLLNANGHGVDKSTDPVLSTLTTNQPIRKTDLQIQTSSGKKVSSELIVSPIGRLGSGAIVVFRDITKDQEEERSRTEFISTASHEMRTPVASIEGYLGLALNPATATIDEKARTYITKAHEAAEHLGHLFQDLLDVTKADDGRLSSNPSVIDTVHFTESIVDSLNQKAIEKNLRLFYKPNTAADETITGGGLRNLAPVFYVNVDKDHLREVIANLVENGIKYTREGQIVVDVQGNHDHVIISITDSGIGIPAEDVSHLFQKFYRVDNSDTREIGGTGLGLYLCRKLVEAMGGRIWVESEYKKGSTFFIELPRMTHEEAQRLIEAAAAQPSPVESRKYVNTEQLESTPEEQATALATPIVTSRVAPISLAPEQTTNTPPEVADPLMQTPQPGPAAPTPPIAPSPQTVISPPQQGATILPPEMQAKLEAAKQRTAAAEQSAPGARSQATGQIIVPDR